MIYFPWFIKAFHILEYLQLISFIIVALLYSYFEFLGQEKDHIIIYDFIILVPITVNIFLSLRSICSMNELKVKSNAIDSIRFSVKAESLYDGG